MEKNHILAGRTSYTTAIGHVCESGWIFRDLLYTKAVPTSFGEWDKKSGKIMTLLGSSDPALRLEALWIRKDFWVHEDEIAWHTDRCLPLHESVSKPVARCILGRLRTPGGIVKPWNVKNSEGATRGDRTIGPGKHRITSFTTPFYVKRVNLSF